MRALSHPAICALYDAFHTPRYVYLVMERGGGNPRPDWRRALFGLQRRRRRDADVYRRCHGGELYDAGMDLYDALMEHGPAFTPAATLRLAQTMAGALAHCWERHLVHRDLKPENVLVDVRGLTRDSNGDLCVKLCDFGLCGRARNGVWAMSDFVGSPGFFAPEILLHDLYDAEKVDVWSLGCVVLEILEGHDGFDQA